MPADIDVRSAQLTYWSGDRTPGRPSQAFMIVDLDYVRPYPYSKSGSRLTFPAAAVRFRPAGGRPLPPAFLTSTGRPVFVVPADLRKGTLLVGGPYGQVSAKGQPFTVVMKVESFPVSLQK